MLNIKDNKYYRTIRREIGDILSLRVIKERRLSFEFAFLTSFVIVFIVLFMGWYLGQATARFKDGMERQNEKVSVAITSTLVNYIAGDIESKNYKEIDRKIRYPLSEKVIAYLVIYDKEHNKVLFSTHPDDQIRIVNSRMVAGPDTPENILNASYIVSERGHNRIYIGFFEDTNLKSFFDSITKDQLLLVSLFIFVGLWLAISLSNRILNPLKSLIQATGEFEQGDLSNRVEKTSYREINELVESYNSMADALQRLYSSMEHKVQERTIQLEQAYKELQSTQAMMVHSEKMKSLGELVAGIMHEINNPINFIYGNLSHLNNYSADLIQIIDKYSELSEGLSPENKKIAEDLKQEIDYEFLKSDLPDLIRSCREGTERTRNIILDLKNFSRMEEVALTNVDLPKEIDTTLNILHNKFKNKVTVHKEYQENLPKIEGYGGQLNQVLMNILDNAAYAIQEKGDVWIRLNTVDNNVIIEFEDNGKGMDEATAQKIFNPFFTTKPVGQGTGLGMSISYKVIKNHQGDIKVDTEPGKGTKFTITLPINRDKEEDSKKQNSDNSLELEVIE